MRKPIVAANWKMNMPPSETEAFLNSFLGNFSGSFAADVVIVPPFVSIPAASGPIAGNDAVDLGAQNMSAEPAGAHTGEISATMLKELAVSYVVLGHSERRAIYGETDELINKKVLAAHEAQITPILCVGETLEEREVGKIEEVLRTQTVGGLAGVSAQQLSELVIAYEPVWAIGTGKTASSEEAQEAHAFYSFDPRGAFECGYRQQCSHPVRRFGEAREHGGVDRDGRHRRRAGWWSEPRGGKLLRDCESGG